MQRAEQLTRSLAAHLRDPDAHPAPAGWEERRTAIYRRLFINNVINLLAGNFPVARRILGEERFAEMVRRFYAEHQSHTPLFPEIAREMLRFVEEQPQYWAEQWPFLYELMHYEWVELALAISKTYGFQLRSDNEDNRRIFGSLAALSEHIEQNRTV